MIMQLYMIVFLHNNMDNLPYLDMRKEKSSATVVSVLGRAINFFMYCTYIHVTCDTSHVHSIMKNNSDITRTCIQLYPN